MNKMIHIWGDDYSALDFEKYIKDKKISFEEFLDEMDNIEYFDNGEMYFEFSVHIFQEIDSKFLEFIRINQDSDDIKHENFYFQNDKLFNHEN